MLKDSLEKKNITIFPKTAEEKKRIKISVGLNDFEVVILCQRNFTGVARKKSDCNGLEDE